MRKVQKYFVTDVKFISEKPLTDDSYAWKQLLLIQSNVPHVPRPVVVMVVYHCTHFLDNWRLRHVGTMYVHDDQRFMRLLLLQSVQTGRILYISFPPFIFISNDFFLSCSLHGISQYHIRPPSQKGYQKWFDTVHLSNGCTSLSCHSRTNVTWLNVSFFMSFILKLSFYGIFISYESYVSSYWSCLDVILHNRFNYKFIFFSFLDTLCTWQSILLIANSISLLYRDQNYILSQHKMFWLSSIKWTIYKLESVFLMVKH